MSEHRLVPVETIVACARKLFVVGQIYDGDKESRRLSDELYAIAAAPAGEQKPVAWRWRTWNINYGRWDTWHQAQYEPQGVNEDYVFQKKPLYAAPASEPTDSRERAKNAAAERRKTQRRNTSKPDTPELMRRANCGDRRQSNVAATQEKAEAPILLPGVVPVSAATPVQVDQSVRDMLREAGLTTAPTASKLPLSVEQIEESCRILCLTAESPIRVQALLAIEQEQRIAKLEEGLAEGQEYEAILRNEIVRLDSELAELKRGEFICKKCGLRKDGEGEHGDF